ncbi:hypothetical protein FRUB_09987 [Fimbriiglobus ruber]|uniref:Uncharacterized protein n=1 Tax=Fimbriiglobus ruber TaxID=1908690 RepID=A0A225DFH8_9BACT|nr:hypothetical protein FRUB_09987 [Fimbriiglobus ruber]
MGNDCYCQILVVSHRLNPLPELCISPVGDQRYDVRIKYDHSGDLRRARASASRSSRSSSSPNTPKCLRTACLEPASWTFPAFSLRRRRSSRRSSNASANRVLNRNSGWNGNLFRYDRLSYRIQSMSAVRRNRHSPPIFWAGIIPSLAMFCTVSSGTRRYAATSARVRTSSVDESFPSDRPRTGIRAPRCTNLSLVIFLYAGVGVKRRSLSAAPWHRMPFCFCYFTTLRASGWTTPLDRLSLDPGGHKVQVSRPHFGEFGHVRDVVEYDRKALENTGFQRAVTVFCHGIPHGTAKQHLAAKAGRLVDDHHRRRPNQALAGQKRSTEGASRTSGHTGRKNRGTSRGHPDFPKTGRRLPGAHEGSPGRKSIQKSAPVPPNVLRSHRPEAGHRTQALHGYVVHRQAKMGGEHERYSARCDRRLFAVRCSGRIPDPKPPCWGESGEDPAAGSRTVEGRARTDATGMQSVVPRFSHRV